MDFSTLLGLGLAWASVIVAQLLDGGNPASLFSHPGPLLLVFGGALTASLMTVRLVDLPGVAKAALLVLVPKKPADVVDAINQIIRFTELARRDGVLALERESKNVEDPFLRRGLELVIDGTDQEVVREVLESDIEAARLRHQIGIGYFTQAGGYAPTLGIVGTVMGLVHILGHLDKPNELGPSIAAAFLATLWGVASANLMWLPFAAKLKSLSAAEMAYREVVLDGLIAMQSGANPSVVGERLKSYLPVPKREGVGRNKGKAAEGAS